MRFIIGLILVAVMAYVLPMFSPYWTIAPAAALIGFGVGAKWWQSLLYGLIATGTVWFVYTFMINQANESILSNKMAEIFNIDGGLLLVVITAAVGAILSGLGALAGSLLRGGILPIAKKEKRGSRRVKKRKSHWN